MEKQCVIVGSKLRRLASLLESLSSSGFTADAIDIDLLDDREILSILDWNPFATILPLSLRGYGSLRLAELIGLGQHRTRLILASGTNAPREFLEELYDVHLPPFGEGLLKALTQRKWVHAFERRRTTMDVAIQQVLRNASCFLGSSHRDDWPTIVDYQRAIDKRLRHFTVLFVASDPTDQVRLRLMKEVSEVHSELSRKSNYSFDLKHAFSSRPDELGRILLEIKPHIVHFSGHGDVNGQLCFEDANGQSWPANKEAISRLFEPCRRYIKCVLLNACYSAKQAELIGKYVEYTIGLSSEVSDDAALALAKGFYGSLNVCGKVSQAIHGARANLKLLDGDATELISQERTDDFIAMDS